MPISDLFGLLQKRQTSPDKYLASSVNVVATGQYGAARPPFSQDRGIRAYRSWIYAAATINAQAVASLPLRLYVKRDEANVQTRAVPMHRKRYLAGDLGGEVRPSLSVVRKASAFGDDLEEVSTHPVCSLLASANPFLNGFDLATLRILYGELTGNAYLHPVIDEATGSPGELWPLAPQYVEVIPDEDRFISGYVYGIDAQRKQVFETDEVIHFRRPNPSNLHYGLGKVEAAYGAVQANEAVHQMDLSTFENSARPDYAVVVKGTPTGDQLDRFQSQVEERLRGTRKDGSFITVTGDVQFTPLNFPPKDLAGREEIVEEIAAVFGVPVSMLKANDPNLASATSGFAQWREGTVLPLCRMDEEELNQSLLPMFGLDDRYCLAYDNPVPSDKAYDLQERQTAVAGGWRTPNEARLDEGREPVEDKMADRLLVNGQPLGISPAGVGLDLPSLPMPEPEREPIADEPETPTEDAEPIAADATPALNGAQVASIVSVLDGVAGGNVHPVAAIELIVASGIGRDAATRMVEAQSQARSELEVDTEIEEEVEDEAEKAIDDRIAGRTSDYDTIKRLQACGLTRKEADRRVAAAVVRREDDLYDTREEAEAVARAIGCEGFHTHDVDGQTLYMPCAAMDDYTEITGERHRDDRDPSLVAEKAIEDVDLQPTQEIADLAQRGLDLREEHGRGGTEVGVARARDLSNRENLSPDTVGRMANFFARHRVDLDAPAAKPGHDEYPSAGVIAWLLWGGDPADPSGAGAAWADRKMDELEAAEEKAAGDRVSSTPADPDERVEGSDRNPEGSASGSRGGIEISEAQEKALKKKVEDHNEKHGDKKGKKVDLGMLKAVYRRGAGAFSTSHRPGMTRQQWSMARVNAFLYLVRNGRPKDAKYTTDNDLLPKGHPKRTSEGEKACGCGGTHTKATGEAYEWPEATRKARLEIEGLDDDFARLRPKAPDAARDADDDVREGERRTPAMGIRDAVADALAKTASAVEEALVAGSFGRPGRKASGTEEAVQRVLRGLRGVSEDLTAKLFGFIEAAAKGGGSVGTSRLNEILAGAGRGRVGRPDPSKALLDAVEKRATSLVEQLIDDSVRAFAEGLDADFSIDEEIRRLRGYGFSKERATVVARTESASAYQQGQIDAWKETGIVQRKAFLLAPGACEFCKAVNKRYGAGGVKGLGLDEPMVQGGIEIVGTEGGRMTPKFDSQGIVHPNCRCDFVPVLED